LLSVSLKNFNAVWKVRLLRWLILFISICMLHCFCTGWGTTKAICSLSLSLYLWHRTFKDQCKNIKGFSFSIARFFVE
uniref:Uncharacterized protein n=1 Tax=Amphimedon queenslandica TaxID=400682 RepID=A0A1X7VAD6_AMPQE